MEERTRVFAFAGNIVENIPVGAPKAGYKWRLSGYEKSPYAHILSIKYDPFKRCFLSRGILAVSGLFAALGFVFFFSHKRVWALVEPRNEGSTQVILGGNANRNHVGFEERFSRIIADLKRTTSGLSE
jgi:cytochrome c biogenesis protein ResB